MSRANDVQDGNSKDQTCQLNCTLIYICIYYAFIITMYIITITICVIVLVNNSHEELQLCIILYFSVCILTMAENSVRIKLIRTM